MIIQNFNLGTITSLEIAWYSLFVILFAIILWVYDSTLRGLSINKSIRLKRTASIILVAFVWFTYVYQISESGILLDRSLPPKFPIFIIFPLFIFTGLFLSLKKNSKALHSLPIYLPIAYQSFRALIEVLFYFTFLNGLFPEVATFSGYNFDFLVGLSAPIIAFVAIRKINPEKLLLGWNILGLVFLSIAVFIVFTSFYFHTIWGSNEPLLPFDFLKFPYILLPAFFMPSAVFMHILSIIQLKRKLNPSL